MRVGGFRVGVVDDDRPGDRETVDGEQRAIAVVDMKLDKTVEPLPVDTTVFVRPRSALGLKYVELTPGQERARRYSAGDTIPLENASTPVEFDDLLNTFDTETRAELAGGARGLRRRVRRPRRRRSTRRSRRFSPFFTHLTPVMQNLSDPRTELDEFFKQIGARVRPRWRRSRACRRELFANMADTFDAIGRDPAACRRRSRSARRRWTRRSELPRAAPVPGRLRRPLARLRPAARELPTALPDAQRRARRRHARAAPQRRR